jgi:hypothetical protein
MADDLLFALQKCDHRSGSDGSLQKVRLHRLRPILQDADQQNARAVAQRVVPIAQQRKKLVRRLLVLQEPVRVLQAEIALRVRGGGVGGVAEDGDGVDGREADIRVDVGVILDDYEETWKSVCSDELLVVLGEALERKDCCASVGEESRGRETVAQAGDGICRGLLYAGRTTKGGVSLLEELHRGTVALRVRRVVLVSRVHSNQAGPSEPLGRAINSIM